MGCTSWTSWDLAGQHLPRKQKSAGTPSLAASATSRRASSAALHTEVPPVTPRHPGTRRQSRSSLSRAADGQLPERHSRTLETRRRDPSCLPARTQGAPVGAGTPTSAVSVPPQEHNCGPRAHPRPSRSSQLPFPGQAPHALVGNRDGRGERAELTHSCRDLWPGPPCFNSCPSLQVWPGSHPPSLIPTQILEDEVGCQNKHAGFMSSARRGRQRTPHVQSGQEWGLRHDCSPRSWGAGLLPTAFALAGLRLGPAIFLFPSQASTPLRALVLPTAPGRAGL